MLTVEFGLPTSATACTYRIKSASRSLAAGNLLEYHEVTEVEMNYLGREENGVVFQVRFGSPQVQANNGVFAWATDVNAFLRDLILLVNPEGKIKQVLNHAELRAKWPSHHRALREAYRQHPHAEDALAYINQAIEEPQFLISQITANGLCDFLFPALCGTYPLHQETPSRKSISSLFGTVPLPLALASTAAVDDTGAVTLRTDGVLDEESLDRDGFRMFLKDLTDMHDVATDLTVEYETMYRHHQQCLQEAEAFLHVQAGGTAYAYTVARHLTILP